MEINDRLKLVRKELKLTQSEFGYNIGLAQGYIANLESSRREVSNKIIKLVCATFNVREEWLINGTGNIFQNETTHLDDSIINTFKELKPEFQEYVLKQINELLKLQNKSIESD